MDPAAALELKMLSYQAPMNDVIDRGDSPVQLLYHDTTVFVTGGAGFIGKQLIEKLFRLKSNGIFSQSLWCDSGCALAESRPCVFAVGYGGEEYFSTFSLYWTFRSCSIKKMYILMRSKKGKTIHERLQVFLSDPVYDLIRKKKPQFADKIVPVEGNVADVRLGLSDDDWTLLTQEVEIIFHLAATVRFNAPLREAVLTNVRGTREAITLAKECTNLKHFLHVSTAYSCATKEHIGKEVFEKFYHCPLSPNVLISMVEELDEKKINAMTEHLVVDWPNTYTFTKAVTEELIRTSAKDLPACIVRPPIVIASHCEPAPGWLDIRTALSGPSSIILAIFLGVIHVLPFDFSVALAFTPVDIVNNAIIGAVWDAEERRKTGDTKIPIYAVTDKDKFMSLGLMMEIYKRSFNFSTDKAVYLCSMIPCRGIIYWFMAWLLHYIPAYCLDIICDIIGKRPKGIASFVGIYRKLDSMSSVFEYFGSYEWQFRNDNLVAMRNKMSEADKAIYNCDLSKIDLTEFIRMWGVGIRKYVIKDGLRNSNLGYKKQQIFKIVNYIVLPLYLYLLWTVWLFIIKAVVYVINILCF